MSENLPERIIPEVNKVWEQRPDETEKAYQAFCIYLALPKEKDGVRNQSRVAETVGCNKANISPWAVKNEWQSRAEAYDTYMSFRPTEIAELAYNRIISEDYRAIAKELRDKAKEAISKITVKDDMKITDIMLLLTTSDKLEEKASKLDAPRVADKKEKLTNEIGKLVEQLAAGQLAGVTGGSARRTVSATERKVSIEYGSDEPESLCEIQDVSGEVCEGDFTSDMVEQTN